jgi:hypothetical protein
MSKTFTNEYILDTYTGILHSDLTLPETGQSTIYDGEGNESSLKLGRACNGATICGTLTVDDLIINNAVADDDTTLINKIYPIGSIYFSATSTNPAATIGGGWNQIANGQFIIGVGSNSDVNGESVNFGYGSNGGEYSHALTESEMPSHRHGLVAPDGTQFYVYNDINDVPSTVNQEDGAFRGDGPDKDRDAQFWPNMQTSGGNQKHNNTPPAFGLYVWQRVS